MSSDWIRLSGGACKSAFKLLWLFRPTFNSESKQRKRIFINIRPAQIGGPKVFVHKISKELTKNGIDISYNQVSGCRAALILIQSIGDEFFKMARRNSVRTVGRIAGFYPPVYFDNRPYFPPLQDRRLTLDKIKFNQRLQRDLYMFDHVIYQSLFTKNMCDLYLYKRTENYSIIHNGVDTDLFCPSQENSHPLTLINVGSLRHEYIFNTLFPVFLELKKKYRDLRLFITGPMDEACQLLLAEYGTRYKNEFKEGLRYFGVVPNDKLPDIYRQADIYLHPRQGDWSPNAMIEALASGLPVVCARWGGQSEIVGEAGIVLETEPWDYSQGYIEGFIEGTRTVIEHLAEYKALARKYALENLDLRHMTQRYLNVLFEGN